MKKNNAHNNLKHRIELLKKNLVIFILILFMSSFQNADAAIRTWTGSTSTDWTVASNWNNGVPNSGDDVLIPGGLTNYPVISTTVTVETIQINNTGSGATLTVLTGANLTLSGAGNDYELVSSGGTLLQSGGTITTLSKKPTIAGTFTQSGGSFFTDQDVILTGVINQTDGLIHMAKNSATNPAKIITITNGTINQSGGTIYLKDHNASSGSFYQTGFSALLKIFHDWKPTSDHTFNSTAGTIQFTASAGGADFSSSNTQFYHIIVDAGVDPKFDDDENSQIKIRGNFTNYNTGLDNSNKAIFTFNGTGPQTITSASINDKRTFGHLTIDNDDDTVSFASNINIDGGLTVKAGSTLDLSTYTLGDVVPMTSTVLEGGASVGATIIGTGTLSLGSNVTVNISGTGNDGAGILCPVALDANRIFTVADDGTSATDLTIGGAISGAFTVTKNGSGIMVLSGANTYTGNTIINTGSIILGNAGSIPDGSDLILNGGTFSSGSTSGFNETLGTLNFSANSTINLGSGAHTLAFAASNSETWPVAVITIDGWSGGYDGTSGTGGKVKFGTSAAGLTADQLLKIRFYDGNDYYQAALLSDGELVALSALHAPHDLSYSTPNYFIKGVDITPMTPTVQGFVDTYTISPELPDDLVINSLTGVISGEPKNTSYPITYTITASGISGSTSFDIVIAIGSIIETGGSGNWSSTVINSPWPNGIVPKAWDHVRIKKDHTVTVDINNAACASLLLGKDDGIANLDFSGSNPKLSVLYNVDVGSPNEDQRVGVITFSSDATLLAGSVTLNKNDKDGTDSEIDMTAGGLIRTGSFEVGGDGSLASWTPGTGTVEMTTSNTLPSTIFTSFNKLRINSGTTTTGVAITSVSDTLRVNAGATLSMGHNIGATTPPSSIELEWGLAGSVISGTGTLTLGGPVNVSYVASGSEDAEIAVPLALAATRTFSVESDGNTDSTGLSVSSVISGTGYGLTKDGAGTMALLGLNTYTGLTVIDDGMLIANTLLNIGGGASSVGAPATVTNGIIDISGTGTLKYIGAGNTSDRVINLTGDGGTIDASGSGTLTLSGGVTGSTYGLVLAGSGNGVQSGVIGTGSGTMTKDGTGTWTLSAANTYTGGTTITSGTLELGAANRLVDAGTIEMNGGTFSTGATTGYSETVGTLTLTDDSHINFGTGVHTLNFASSNSLNWTAGKTITITGWSGDYEGSSGTAAKIFVGNSTAGLTADQLSRIYFYNGFDYYPAVILSTGELVAVSPAVTIATGSITGSPFCAGSYISVPYTITGTYTSGNVFSAELSDASGNFDSAVTVGTLTSVTSGTISGILPVDAAGTGYRIRVIASAPAVIGLVNNSDLIINEIEPVSVIISASENPVCAGDTVTFTAVPTNGGASPSYQWRINGVNVGTDSETFATNAVSDGNFIDCILTSSAACTSGNPATSNSITMGVIDAPIASFNYTGSPYCQWDSNPSPTFIGGGEAGTFSSTAGLVFVSTATGVVNLSASTPGTYVVTNTIISSGECGNRIATSLITIHSSLYWTGAVSTDWNDTDNWACGMLPDLNRTVEIPDVTNKPVLNLGAVGAAGNLIIESGSSLTVIDNTLQLSGTITNSGSFTATEGTIEMKGSSAQTIGASLFAGNTISGLTINNSSGVTLQGALNVTGILTTTSGTLASNGNLTLVSTETQTALVDGSGAGSITGDVVVQRYLASTFGYKYFSSPVQGATVIEFDDEMDLDASFPTFYSYDESKVSSGWVDYTNTSGILYTMHGYAVNFGPNITPATVDITGTVNNGSLQRTLYNNNNTYTKGFNLVGNPYPSPIDWNAASGWTKTNIDNALYFFKSGGYDQYSGTYHTYINGVSSDGLASNIIPTMQGFFIHVSDGVWPITGTLGMTNEVRVADFSQEFLKTETMSLNSFVRLTAQFNDIQMSTDAMVIYFDENASPYFDKEYDALKLINTDFYVPNFYSIASDDYKLSINALPKWNDSLLIVPVGIKTLIEGNVTFKLADINKIPSDTYVYLYDDLTKMNYSLNFDKDYTVFMEAGVYDDRYLIKFTLGSDIIPNDNNQTDLLNVRSFNGKVMADIQISPGGKATIYINSITGQPVYKKDIYESGNYVFTPQLKTGIYIVTLTSEDTRKSRKVFILTK